MVWASSKTKTTKCTTMNNIMNKSKMLTTFKLHNRLFVFSNSPNKNELRLRKNIVVRSISKTVMVTSVRWRRQLCSDDAWCSSTETLRAPWPPMEPRPTSASRRRARNNNDRDSTWKKFKFLNLTHSLTIWTTCSSLMEIKWIQLIDTLKLMRNNFNPRYSRCNFIKVSIIWNYDSYSRSQNNFFVSNIS